MALWERNIGQIEKDVTSDDILVVRNRQTGGQYHSKVSQSQQEELERYYKINERVEVLIDPSDRSLKQIRSLDH
jgi:hypothetical protein